MMVRMLEKSGCSAKAVGNGREALEAISAEEPDLILLDLMMPVMDGFEFLMQLRSQPRWRELPVIVVTAKELTEEDRLQLSGKVEQVLEKGAYTREELIELVRGMIAEHSEARPGVGVKGGQTDE
jgi:CheY-like chemotaxis protein